MSRLGRFIINEGTYHIILRGNNRNNIFLDSNDFKKFLQILVRVKKKFNFIIYHYSLMSNHIHLEIKIEDAKSLSNGIKSLTVQYVNYYRKKYGGVGHFFQGRYKSYLVDNGKYQLQCGIYIENNSVKAGIVSSPEQYKWSSSKYYLTGEKNDIIVPNPEWLALSNKVTERRKIFRDMLIESLNDRRNIERYIKTGFCGDKNRLIELKSKGLKSKWSHSGRPQKS